jgi:phosphoglycolate phosphatase
MTKLVLFDVDKTLIKSSKGHRAAFSVAFKEVYGVNASIDIIQPSGMTDQ